MRPTLFLLLFLVLFSSPVHATTEEKECYSTTNALARQTAGISS